MGQTNTGRISHKLETRPNVFRDDQLQQIIDDLGEEDTGAGFSEVAYVGATPFVDKITTWDSPAKLKKRAEIQFTYSPSPFLNTIVKTVFDESAGLAAVATITATIVYNVNKTIKEVNVVTARI